MADFSPGSPLGLFILLITTGGLAGLVKVVHDIVKDRRDAKLAKEAAQRAQEPDPVEDDSVAVELANQVMALSSQAVAQAVGDLQRQAAAHRADLERQDEQHRADLDRQDQRHRGDMLRATEALEVSSKLQARTVDALVDAHDWIDAGAQPPAPSWPHWLPRHRHP